MSKILLLLCVCLSAAIAMRQMTASAGGSGHGPSVRLTWDSPAKLNTAAITVAASDPDGLAGITIVDRADDVQYQTELAGTGVKKKFQRTFALSEILPSAPKAASIVLEVIVTDTKGQATTARAEILLEK